MKHRIRGALGLALIWPVLVAVAQNTNSGDIRGVVTDSAGAVIPGAAVRVDDVDKGISHTYTTDGPGLYDTGSIVPDHYLITITAPGFQSYGVGRWCDDHTAHEPELERDGDGDRVGGEDRYFGFFSPIWNRRRHF